MKYWVFDLDGTMVDSFGPYYNFLENQLETKLSSDLKKEYISKHPLVVLENSLGAERASLAMNQLIQRDKVQVNEFSLFQGVHSAVDLLLMNHKRVSVWTSRDLETAKAILDFTGLTQKIDLLVAGDQVKKRKPDTEGILKIQQHYNCESHEMVMIGDHDHDMQAAKSFGVHAVRASWHDHFEHDECELADRQFYCHQDFKNWVSAL